MTSGFTWSHSFSACRHHAGKFAIDDQHFRLGVVEREGEDRRVEPRVERVEHRPASSARHSGIRPCRACWPSSPIRCRLCRSRAGERAGEAPAARVEIAIGAPQRAMDRPRRDRETPARRAPERSAASAAGNSPRRAAGRHRGWSWRAPPAFARRILTARGRLPEAAPSAQVSRARPVPARRRRSCGSRGS
jgi:hypothetical protein